MVAGPQLNSLGILYRRQDTSNYILRYIKIKEEQEETLRGQDDEGS
jgi:hypothetical protein